MLLLNMIKKQMTKDKEETDLHSYWMAFKNFKKEKKKDTFNAPFRCPTPSQVLLFRIYFTKMLFKESFCLEVHNNSEYTNTMFYLYIHTDPLQGVNNILTGLTTLILLIAQTMTYKTPICNAPPNQTTANNLNVSQSLKETIQLMLQPISLKLFLVSDSKKKKKVEIVYFTEFL